MDTIWMPYGDIQEIQYIKYIKTFHQNASSFLVQSTTCFLIDSTILRRKYKDQPFNFTILNSSSMQYLFYWKEKKNSVSYSHMLADIFLTDRQSMAINRKESELHIPVLHVLVATHLSPEMRIIQINCYYLFSHANHRWWHGDIRPVKEQTLLKISNESSSTKCFNRDIQQGWAVIKRLVNRIKS